MDHNIKEAGVADISEFIDNALNAENLDRPNVENKRGLRKSEWTVEVATELRDYAYKAAGYSWMYSTDAAHYFTVNTRLNVITALLAAISAIGIAGGIICVQSDNRAIIAYYVLSGISIVINLIIGLLTAYRLTMNFEFRISQTLEKAAKFGKLCRKIRLQFSLNIADRDDPTALLREVCDRFDELDREKPFLRTGTASAWKNHLAEIKSDVAQYDSFVRMPVELRTGDRSMHKIDFTKKGPVSKWIGSMV